ncbi:MAG: hypothetical protein IJE14_12030 [Clostridia bacterium]|nr:hypothetical protein [Clostridia bacterium]MBQ6931890.1 hypothetical protein [Clostridia bacterium]
MKLYNKPELNVEKFDVEDVITGSVADADQGEFDFPTNQTAGMEFDITAEGNEF